MLNEYPRNCGWLMKKVILNRDMIKYTERKVFSIYDYNYMVK